MNYEKLGFKNLEEFIDYFLNTLLPSNKTYEYFVDWNKVKNNVKKYLTEIYLLNSLIKVKPLQRAEYLKELLEKYPKIIEIIPIIIAERLTNKIDIFEPEIEEFFTIEFKQTDNEETIIFPLPCYNKGK